MGCEDCAKHLCVKPLKTIPSDVVKTVEVELSRSSGQLFRSFLLDRKSTLKAVTGGHWTNNLKLEWTNTMLESHVHQCSSMFINVHQRSSPHASRLDPDSNGNLSTARASWNCKIRQGQQVWLLTSTSVVCECTFCHKHFC